MSSCEKCWRDAYGRGGGSQSEEYSRLVAERNCTPEEQAGPDSTECPVCYRKTVHQHTGECMACCLIHKQDPPDKCKEQE